MIQRKAALLRLYPTPEQEEQLAQLVGTCRFVYNLALEQRRDFRRQYRRRRGANISFASQCRELCEAGMEAAGQQHVDDVAHYLARHRIAAGSAVGVHAGDAATE